MNHALPPSRAARPPASCARVLAAFAAVASMALLAARPARADVAPEPGSLEALLEAHCTLAEQCPDGAECPSARWRTSESEACARDQDAKGLGIRCRTANLRTDVYCRPGAHGTWNAAEDHCTLSEQCPGGAACPPHTPACSDEAFRKDLEFHCEGGGNYFGTARTFVFCRPSWTRRWMHGGCGKCATSHAPAPGGLPVAAAVGPALWALRRLRRARSR